MSLRSPTTFALLLSVLVSACAASAPAAPAPPTQCPSSPSISSAPPPAPPTPTASADVTIALRPVLVPSPELHVTVELRGPAPDLRAFHVLAGHPSSFANVHAEDVSGAIPTDVTGDAGGVTIRLARDPSGAVTLDYDVSPAADGTRDPLALAVDPNHARASFESVLALPAAFESRPLDAELRASWPKDYAWTAAWSYGLGETRRVRATGHELRHVTLLVGELGHARFEAYEGHDEIAWLGFTRFDPRWVAAESASARTAIDGWFGGRSLPFAITIVAEKRPDDPFALARRAGGLLVVTHFDAPWNASTRLRLAQEFGRRWLGGMLSIGPRDPSHEPLGRFWSDGFNRAITRDVLFALGTISPDELGEEVRLLEATEQLSPHRGKSNDALAALSDDRDADALLTARGALYATRLDALLLAHSKRQKSLRELVRSLFAKAKAANATELPEEALTAAIGAELGDGEVATFRRVMHEGAFVELPKDALGPCFELARVRYEAFELGFDEVAPGDAPGRTITHLKKGSRAEHAGVREGDAIVSLAYERGKPRSSVSLSVKRGERVVAHSFLPVGESREAPGFLRRKGTKDDACAR